MTLFGLACSSAYAGDSPSCKKIFLNGERADTTFEWIPFGLSAHFLAEKYCGAKPIPMAPKFLGFLESRGCGPETEVYRATAESVSKVQTSELETMVTGGKPTVVATKEKVQEVAARAVEQLGGCEKLIRFHDNPFPAK
jgi:hypothetical protein